MKDWCRMRFLIDAECRRGLRIIGEIPDISPARLEGYNGIGKTAAIKLLEICTGRQPFEHDERAWKTFREQLVSATVILTELDDAQRIEWQLLPKSWPSTPEPLADRVGTISINGHRALPRDITSLIQVHRIAGDETFPLTLAARVEAVGSAMTTWRKRVGEERLRGLELALGQLQIDIQEVEPATVSDETRAVRQIERSLELLRSEAASLGQRVRLLGEAESVSEKLDEVRGRGPELDDEISRLEIQRDAVRTDRAELELKILEASERESRDADARREFDNAERYLTRQEAQVSKVRSEVSSLAASLGISPIPQELEASRTSATIKLQELTEQLPRVHSAPLMAELLEEAASALGRAWAAGLGDAVIYEGNLQDISVSGLSELLDEAARNWRHQVPSADAEQLEAEIEATRRQLVQNARLKRAIGESEQLQAKYDRAKARLVIATDALPAATARTLRGLIEARNQLDAQRDEIEDRLVRLRFARSLLGGGSSEEELLKELGRLSRELKVETSRIRGRLNDERSQLRSLTERLESAESQLRHAQETLAQKVSALQDLTNRLLDREEYSWLRRISPSVLPQQDMNLNEQAAMLVRLSKRLEDARDRVSRARKIADGVPTALQELSNQFRGSAISASGTWAPAIRRWLASDVAEMFSNEQVREALFPGGESVELDLVEMVVSWISEDGPQSRPLSGFSSGEQALAYSRARIAAIETLPASSNRLVALDEFGAFIDADRMSKLEAYLQERSASVPGEHTILILPSSIDQISSNSGNEIGVRRQQLADRGYFVERLSS